MTIYQILFLKFSDNSYFYLPYIRTYEHRCKQDSTFRIKELNFMSFFKLRMLPVLYCTVSYVFCKNVRKIQNNTRIPIPYHDLKIAKQLDNM